jgi:hypothetical protein
MRKQWYPMGGLLRQELRWTVRCWPLWALPPLAGALGWAMLPVNANAYLTYVYDDPQGPDQVLDAYQFDVSAVYTSGLGWVQLLALLAGATLVLRDPRLTGRRAAAHPPPDPGPLLVAKAAVAALLAAALAVVDLLVVVPQAGARLADHWAVAPLAQEGVSAPPASLLDRPVWTAVLCAVANAPLFALFGVGLGARAGRWWLPAAAIGFPAALFLLYQAQYQSWLDRVAAPVYVIVGLPALPFVLLWYLTLMPATAAVGVVPMLIVAAGVFLSGYAATRRRLAVPTPPVPSGRKWPFSRPPR